MRQQFFSLILEKIFKHKNYFASNHKMFFFYFFQNLTRTRHRKKKTIRNVYTICCKFYTCFNFFFFFKFLLLGINEKILIHREKEIPYFYKKKLNFQINSFKYFLIKNFKKKISLSWLRGKKMNDLMTLKNTCNYFSNKKSF